MLGLELGKVNYDDLDMFMTLIGSNSIQRWREGTGTHEEDETKMLTKNVKRLSVLTLDYCNSLYCKLPTSQLSHLQQIHNFLARTVVKAPKSCHITPILRSLLAQNHSTHRIQATLTYLLSSRNYPTFITSSLFNVMAVLALHPSLLLLGQRHYPL